MKTITKAELISMDACEEGLGRFIEQTNNTDEPVSVSSLFNGKNTISDLVWLAGEICNIEKIRKFARDVALINIELTKQYCSDSDYELMLNFLKTGENNATTSAHATVAASSVAGAAYAAYAVVAADCATDTPVASYVASYAADVASYAVACAVSCDSDVEEVDFTLYLQELFS